ncbi:MAG: response regulator [Planctomycetes bacterium]|nr:response regulator [Planctomycetota bacterium]
MIVSAFLASYFKDKAALIVDDDDAICQLFMKSLIEVGFLEQYLYCAKNIDDAFGEIDTYDPEIIICSLNVQGRNGLEILKKTKMAAERSPEGEKMFFVIKKSVEEDVAIQAMGEYIDEVFLKPYNAENVTKGFFSAILKYSRPVPYITIIKLAEKLIEMGKIDESIPVLEIAKTMDPRPALQCYVSGQAYEKKNDRETAIKCYVKGLRYNKFHYKCLDALYNSLIAQGKEKDAYLVLKRISTYFPLPEEKIKSLVQYAWENELLADLEEYNNSFLKQRVADYSNPDKKLITN